MKNCCTWLSVVCVLGLLHASRAVVAQQPSAPAPAADDAFDPMETLLEFGDTSFDPAQPATETNALQLLIKEASELRDPFWPAGYEPPKASTSSTLVIEQVTAPVVEEEPRWEEAMREVSVKGIMSVGGGRFMAVVNGQVVGDNDTVSVQYGTRTYRWRINSISSQGVKFQKMTVSR